MRTALKRAGSLAHGEAKIPLSSRTGTSATTTLTMPARASTTASYVTVYTLTVNGGTGGGSYPAGKVVSVEANPPSRQRFSELDRRHPHIGKPLIGKNQADDALQDYVDYRDLRAW